MSFFSQSGHWYRIDASGNITPAHDFDLRDARKHNAFPSVTTILKERSNPALERWKMGHLFDTILVNKRKKGEPEEAYRGRIAELCSKKGDDAADFGTRLHDALDIYPQLSLEADLHPYVDAFGPSYDRIVKQRICSEIMLADTDIGVAGRTDLIADTHEWGLAVIDYKTSKFRDGKPSFWSSYQLQLAFYAKAYQKKMGLAEAPAIVNCGINSESPCEPVWKAYTKAEQEQAYAEFLSTAYLWFATKKYWPATNGVPWNVHMQVNGKILSS